LKKERSMSEHNNPVVSSEETAQSNELALTDETRELEKRHSDGITTRLLFNKSIMKCGLR
jgi:hypothetical protein